MQYLLVVLCFVEFLVFTKIDLVFLLYVLVFVALYLASVFVILCVLMAS